MSYSVQPKDRISVKDYGFLFFTKNMGQNIGKNISSEYSQKLLDHVKQSAADALKLFQKEQFEKQQKQLVI